MFKGARLSAGSFFALAVFFGATLPSMADAAFGVSPPFIHADHLTPGAQYEQIIYLVRDNADIDLRVNAEVDLPESVRSWLTIVQGEEFIIPKGTEQFPVAIQIKVPQGADLAAYDGKIHFVSSAPAGGQVGISLGVQVLVDITVGDDVYRKIRIPVVDLLDIEEGWNPKVYIKFVNEGNVSESFDRATYELFDQFKGVRLAYTQKVSDFAEIAPFSTEEFSVEFPLTFHIGLGEYWGSVTFFQGDATLASKETVFRVLERGSLSSPFQVLLRSLKQYWWAYILIFIILILGFRYRKRFFKK